MKVYLEFGKIVNLLWLFLWYLENSQSFKRPIIERII